MFDGASWIAIYGMGSIIFRGSWVGRWNTGVGMNYVDELMRQFAKRNDGWGRTGYAKGQVQRLFHPKK